LWVPYKNLFPNISVNELIEKAKESRNKIIQYINDGKLEIIQNEKDYIKKLHKE